VSAPAVLQNDIEHTTLLYRPGQKIERSPFFTMQVVPSAIEPLQTAGGIAKLDSAASYGILQWVELKNAANPVATKPIFTGEGMHLQLKTSTPATITNTQTDQNGTFDLYLAAFIQDPNSCVRGSNSFTVPENDTYIQAAYVDPNGTNTITFNYATPNEFTIPLVEKVNLFLINASTRTTAYNTGAFIINIKGTSLLFPTPPSTTTVSINLTLNLLSNEDIVEYTTVCSELVSEGV